MRYAILMLCIFIPATTAAGPASGFFVGGGVQLQQVNGTGTWGPYDFAMDYPLPTEGSQAIGMAWSDNILLGLKPMLGYRLGQRISVQVGYTANASKTSQQTWSEATSSAYYEQGMIVEWQQRSLELVGLFHPQGDHGFYLFGGWDLTRIDADISIYEGAEWEDGFGDSNTAFESETVADDITASGLILGGGYTFPSGDGSRAAFVSVQYSTARTKGRFFETNDFNVDMGGVALMVGLRWFPFR